jgi:AraC-like DNA-binding protein
MKITTHYPSEILKPFIREYKIVESDSDAVNEILPDTAIVMVFRYNMSEINAPKGGRSLVTGISPKIRSVNYSSGMRTLLVLFREGGAASLLKIPLNELLGKHAHLDDIMPAYIMSEIESKLDEAENNYERLVVVESFLLGMLATKEPDPRITFAVHEIRKRKGNVNISKLANSVNISLDPFEKKFRRIIGTSPKQFASIVKLRSTIQYYPHARNLTDLAHQMNYFDQSHLIKEFKNLTGKTPGQFFRGNNSGMW